MRRFVGGVIRHRRWVLLGCALLTALAAASLSRVKLGSSFAKMFLGENPAFSEYSALAERFGSDQILLIGVDDPEFLTPAGQARLRAALEPVRALPGVARARSVLDAARLEPGPLLPRVVNVAQLAAAEPERADALREALAKDPLAGGLLVGRDGQSHAVVIELTADDERSTADIPVLVGEVLAAFHAQYPPDAVHQAGLPAQVTEVLRQTIQAIAITTPLVALVLLISVWVLFGRPWPALVSLGVAAIAVVWSLGFAVALDRNLHVLTATVPGVILIIAFSDIVHLCSAYLLELDEQETQEQAVLAACSEVGRACLFTSLTTCVGFLCLSLVPVPVFRVLGVVLGFGVGAALLLAVTLVPILFSLLPPPRPLKATAAGPQRLIERGLGVSERLALRRPRTVVLAFAVVAAGAIWGASGLTIETDFNARLTPDNRIRQDGEWFAARFRGVSSAQLYLQAPTPEAARDPAWLAQVLRFQRAAADVPGVESVSSLLDVLTFVHRATPAGQETPDLPDDPRALGPLLQVVLSATPPDELRPLFDAEEGRLRLLVALDGHAMRESAGTCRALEALAAEHGLAQIHATGLLPLFGEFLDEVVRAQQEGLGISIVTIALLMTLGLRSLRVGLVSMVPNLLPLGVVAACLGVAWAQVDSDAISLTFVALGIGVDDTIHFLVRLRFEQRGGGTREAAIQRTFAFAGRGIVITTLILSLGFLPFLLSDYFYMRMLGSLLPLCFVVALLADVLLIPALVQLGWIDFTPKSASSPA